MTQWFQTLDNSQHRTVVPERSGGKKQGQSPRCFSLLARGSSQAAARGGETQTEPGGLTELRDGCSGKPRQPESAKQRGETCPERERTLKIYDHVFGRVLIMCMCEKKLHEAGIEE